MRTLFFGLIALIALALPAAAQNKNDNIIRITGATTDAVMGALMDHGYVQDGPMYTIGNDIRFACLHYEKASPLGIAVVKVWLRHIGHDSTDVTGTVNQFQLQYGNGWKKYFLQLAAVCGGKGGKVEFSHIDPVELTALKP